MHLRLSHFVDPSVCNVKINVSENKTVLTENNYINTLRQIIKATDWILFIFLNILFQYNNNKVQYLVLLKSFYEPKKKKKER